MTRVTSPDDLALDELCHRLEELHVADQWPAQQLSLCGEYGVYEWFLPKTVGGQEWDEESLIRAYLKLSKSCLTTTFVITQRVGACHRIAASQNESLKEELLPPLISGEAFSTVGISHLTTSRRHLAKPVLRAEFKDNSILLDGYCPWVTGAIAANSVVIGATCEDGRQILVAAPTDLKGVSTPEPPRLIGLNGSKTGRMEFSDVQIDKRWLIAGPENDIMSSGVGAKTGGLQTSTLAIGLSAAALEFLGQEAEKRADLVEAFNSFSDELNDLRSELIAIAGGATRCTPLQLRTRANSFVMRITQAALAAAKGAGYLEGHPVGRWCCESLFFLVWSCPQPVMSANLCELAGIQV